MGRALAVQQAAELRAEFPAWRIRPVSGLWIAARTGAPVVVRTHAVELRAVLRRIDWTAGAS